MGRIAVPFILFVLSGFCGLLYQVVWLRLAFASFGTVSSVVSVLLSVFMAGLAIGTFAGGKWIGELSRRTGISAIYYYAATELLIGLGALTVPGLFSACERFLFAAGEMDSLRYMGLSSLLMAGSILPWCILMGFTFPIMMSFMGERSGARAGFFSVLYLGNVIGAMGGTLLSAFILIELFGFRLTSMIAAVINVLIALISVAVGMRQSASTTPEQAVSGNTCPSVAPALQADKPVMVLPVLFVTGLASMGMEVVWVRGFTKVLGTQIYAFASILGIYLLATWVGSSLYRAHLRRRLFPQHMASTAVLAVTAFFPIVLNDPRILPHVAPGWEEALGSPLALISIVPFCAVLGYLTPQLIDGYSCGIPERAGRAYAVNIAGCIAGPLIASYLLLPVVSIKMSLVILAVPCVLVFLVAMRLAGSPRWQWAGAATAGALMAFSLAISLSYDEHVEGRAEVRRDHVATVVSSGQGMRKQLLVNGIGLTRLTPITKFMAHLPLAFLDHPPESALLICFGMGTTYRSLMSWGVEVVAVELVPSVRDAFGYYHDDADSVLRYPRGSIIIDDGRRYLKRTSRTYDVITVDPPPPVEAAGVSLLMSEDFYMNAKQHLKPEGVLHQWFPLGEELVLNASARAISNAFASVKVYRSMEGWGYHFLASDHPLPDLPAREMVRRMPEAARKDLLEWYARNDLQDIVNDVLLREVPLHLLLHEDKRRVITDDRPLNEYYMLRRLQAKMN